MACTKESSVNATHSNSENANLYDNAGDLDTVHAESTSAEQSNSSPHPNGPNAGVLYLEPSAEQLASYDQARANTDAEVFYEDPDEQPYTNGPNAGVLYLEPSAEQVASYDQARANTDAEVFYEEPDEGHSAEYSAVNDVAQSPTTRTPVDYFEPNKCDGGVKQLPSLPESSAQARAVAHTVPAQNMKGRGNKHTLVFSKGIGGSEHGNLAGVHV